MEKKRVLKWGGIIVLIIVFSILGFSFFVGSQPERFQGVGGKPTAIAYLDNSLYIYDSGSGKVSSDCWCPLAGVTLTKPAIWVVNPETRSVENIIIEDDRQFSATKERIKGTLEFYRITANDDLISTPDGWTIQLSSYSDSDNIWANKMLVIKDPEGLATDIRPVKQRMSILSPGTRDDIVYVVSSELVPIDDPEDASKFYTGEVGPRVQDTITNTWNRVDDVLLAVNYKTGNIVNKYTFGGSRITYPLASYEFVFNDKRYLYVKRSGWRDTVSDSTIENFIGVFDKEKNVVKPPNEQEEYALLSNAYWFDDNWIIGSRIDENGDPVYPIGNTQLRITDLNTGLSTDLVLDVPKNKVSRSAYGVLSFSFGVLVLFFLTGIYEIFGIVFVTLALAFSIWWILHVKEKKLPQEYSSFIRKYIFIAAITIFIIAIGGLVLLMEEFPSQAPEATKPDAVLHDEVIDRQTYQNEDYINAFYREAQVYKGVLKSYHFLNIYEVSYPETYTVRDGNYERSILLTSPNQGHSIGIREIKRLLSPEDAIAYFWDYEDKRPMENFVLGGKPGRFHFSLSGAVPVQYQAATILDNGVSYVITAEWVGEAERQQAIDAFYTIITSFRFIE